MKKQIYATYERCINCKGCEVACQREHNGISFISVVLVEDRFAVPLTCRQCDPAPCAMACPTGALSFEGGGARLDAAKCTACTLCLFACPFGVLVFDAAAKVAANCDLCAARQKQGYAPACVLTCPSSALRHGDYNSHVAGARRRASAEILRAQPLKGGVR